MTRHAATLWASDVVSVRTRTAAGVVDLYPLFFIHVSTRRVTVSTPGANPDADRAAQQARNASMQMGAWNRAATHLLTDHDTKYPAGFDAAFAAQGTAARRVGPRGRTSTRPRAPSAGPAGRVPGPLPDPR